MVDEDEATLLAGLWQDMQSWHIEDLAAMVDVFAFAHHLGFERAPLPSSLSPVARAVHCFLRHQLNDDEVDAGFQWLHELNVDTRVTILEQAEAFIARRFALHLARELEWNRLRPAGSRLAMLLAIEDPASCQRLLQRLGEASGFDTAAWIRNSVEVVLAVTDRRLLLPGWLEDIAHYLRTADPVSVRGSAEMFAAQLRLTARLDLAQALGLLQRAVLEVGHYEIEDGMYAILGRLAITDTLQALDYVANATLTLEHQALACRCAVFRPRDVSAAQQQLEDIADRFAAAIQRGSVAARPAWSIAFELLAAAASIGDTSVAARVVQMAGPPLWTVFSATWHPVRRRTVAGWRNATVFWEHVTRAWHMTKPGIATRRAPPPPSWQRFSSATLSALWRLKTLPDEVLPWWTPWNGGLP